MEAMEVAKEKLFSGLQKTFFFGVAEDCPEGLEIFFRGNLFSEFGDFRKMAGFVRFRWAPARDLKRF